MKHIVAYILISLMFIFNSYSQNERYREKEYSDIFKIDLENDSLPNFIISLKKKLKKAKKGKNILLVADNNFFLSLIYTRLKSYNIAIDYNIKAQKIYEQVKDTIFLIKSYKNMGLMYIYSGNNKISIEYNNKNLKLAKILNDSVLIKECYINLSANYIALKNDSLGVGYYKKALKISKEIGSEKNIAYLYSNFGSYNYFKNNYDSALVYYNKSLNIVKNYKYLIVAGLYSNIAQVLLKQKRYKEALKNAEISIELYKRKDMITEANDAYRIAIVSYAELNDLKKIPNYLASYDSIMQKTVNVRKTEHKTKLKVLYDIGKYENTINKLDVENKLKSSKIFFISLLLLVSVITIVLIIIQNFKLKKSYKIIVKDSIKVLKAEDENKELKKLVKNVEKDNIVTDGADSKLFKEIVNVIESKKLYLNPDFNLRKLAELLKTNRSYISKAINIITKKSFVEFINDYRIDEAKRLLANNKTNLTIEAIGEMSGFNSYSTFTRVFKTTSGVTPSFFMNNIDA